MARAPAFNAVRCGQRRSLDGAGCLPLAVARQPTHGATLQISGRSPCRRTRGPGDFLNNPDPYLRG